MRQMYIRLTLTVNHSTASWYVGRIKNNGKNPYQHYQHLFLSGKLAATGSGQNALFVQECVNRLLYITLCYHTNRIHTGKCNLQISTSLLQGKDAESETATMQDFLARFHSQRAGTFRFQGDFLGNVQIFCFTNTNYNKTKLIWI